MRGVSTSWCVVLCGGWGGCGCTWAGARENMELHNYGSDDDDDLEADSMYEAQQPSFRDTCVALPLQYIATVHH